MKTLSLGEQELKRNECGSPKSEVKISKHLKRPQFTKIGQCIFHSQNSFRLATHHTPHTTHHTPPLLTISPTLSLFLTVLESRKKMTNYCSRMLTTFRSRTDLLFNNSIPFPNLASPKRDRRNYCVKSSTLDPPDVARLAHTARISLTPQEVEQFGPKIQKVVDWFGQLQAVDLESIEPAIRSDIDGNNLRGDVPLKFENREAIIAAIPSYDEPYIKVPRVLNKE